MKIHECVNCGNEIEVDYSSVKEEVNCPGCGAKYKVNFDAEFDWGWKDLTTINPVTPNPEIDKELELYEMRRGLV